MAIPAGHAIINPFIICDDVNGLMRYLTTVFDAVERPEARTADTDGLLIHAEQQIGDVTVMFCDRKPDWPYLPALLQIYVPHAKATIDRMVAGGATVITQPTDFFGTTFSRVRDPWHNLWWVYDVPADDGAEDASADRSAEVPVDPSVDQWSDDGAAELWEQTPELTYIRDTVAPAIASLTDPRSG